ncbi:MAG: hypothetical protein KAS12_06665, partial [Candidatus Aenigmarchaeota archaeon]|nr:hypothetical protein [Candidatus Aenigmarchaeota archaeon]
GKRAYAEINEGDAINTTIMVSKNNDRTRREIQTIVKVSDSLKNGIIDGILKEVENRSKISSVEFIAKSKTLEKLSDKMTACASAIKRAIVEGSPIYLRHHADTDGYVGALALEQVILKLIEKQYANDSDAKYKYYNRTPSKAPFYEYVDVIRDISDTVRAKNRFGQKTPLVILVDNGSTNEDVLSIAKAKIYGLNVVVVDHHKPGKIVDGKSAVDEFVDVHVNPYLVGGDKNLTAGMLGVEIARILGDVKEPECLCALAGVGDHSKCDEFNQYLKKSGKSVEYFEKLSLLVDFEAYYLRFMTDSTVISDIMYGGEKIVELLYAGLSKKIEAQKKVCEHYMDVSELKNAIFMILDLDLTTMRGEFPPAGKTIGIAHEILVEKHKGKVVVSVGYGPDFVTIRATANAETKGFDVNKIVADLKKKMPYSACDGGGHEVAGSIKFVAGAKDEVLKAIKDVVLGL